MKNDFKNQPLLSALHNTVAELGSSPRGQWSEAKARELQETLQLLHAWIRDREV